MSVSKRYPRLCSRLPKRQKGAFPVSGVGLLSLALAGSLFIVVQGSSSCVANAEPAFVAKLRPLIQSAMKDWVTPGIMVLVDVAGQSTWIEGFGTSDLATKAPMSADDHHRVGSVTKS